MQSFRRLALLLALLLPAICAVQAQSPSNPSSSDSAALQQSTQNQGQLSVQARIKARREQRRLAAIQAAYSHRYEAYVGGGYMRFTPGPILQRVNEKSWNGSFTNYYNERLGATIEASGLYARAFIEPQTSGDGTYAGDLGLTKPAIHEYVAMGGPTYRFYLQPKYSVAGKVVAGIAHGDFSGDTSGIGDSTLSTELGLYPDGYAFAAGASIIGEYNLTPNLGIRVEPKYLLTGFGSTTQNSLGFTIGVVCRFGKQK